MTLTTLSLITIAIGIGLIAFGVLATRNAVAEGGLWAVPVCFYPGAAEVVIGILFLALSAFTQAPPLMWILITLTGVGLLPALWFLLWAFKEIFLTR